VLVDGPLSALDLQDLVNEIRNAGAEAISLNGERLVVYSVFVIEEKGGVMVGTKSIQRPYLFQAIGDPDTIETALLRPGGVVALLRRTYPNLTVQTAQHTHLVLGVHRPRRALQYVQAIE
jgi:uncharacterized protein YlxW (UPF0749 family)